MSRVSAGFHTGILFFLLPAISAGSSQKQQDSFLVKAPSNPLVLKFNAPRRQIFGRTETMRLVYYATSEYQFDDLDRAAIQRQIRLIQDFYRYFGLEIPVENRVYEVRAGTDSARYPEGQYDYHYIQNLLRKERLYVSGRTIVFAGFDVGLGGNMALTTINDPNTRSRECPRGHSGKTPWWCGHPESEHWGGIVHEVGHMLGLAHPADHSAAARSESSDDAELSVMGRHWRFLKDPSVGLLPQEIEQLYRRFHDPGADSPAFVRSDPNAR